MGLVSGYQTADGSTHALADVWLAVDHSGLQSNVTSLVDAMASFGSTAPVPAGPATAIYPTAITTPLVLPAPSLAVPVTVADLSKLVPTNPSPLSLGKG